MTTTSARFTGTNPDIAGGYIAHGVAGGSPFVAEGTTEADAEAEAVTLVFECHAARRMRQIAAFHRDQKT